MWTRLACALILAALFAGCGDDDGPTKPPAPVEPTYLVPSTPQATLENMRLAYVFRDSVETDSVYHADYQGQSSNVSDPPGTLPLVFTKAEEVSHVGALRKDPETTGIYFNIGAMDSWVREPSLDVSHPEWASITLSRGIKLEITTFGNLYYVGTDDFFEFQFAPITPAASSPTDTLWQIIRWRELKGAGG